MTTVPQKETFRKYKKLNLTDKMLSDMSGVSPQIVNYFRKREGYNITAKNLLKICKALGLELVFKGVEVK